MTHLAGHAHIRSILSGTPLRLCMEWFNYHTRYTFVVTGTLQNLSKYNNKICIDRHESIFGVFYCAVRNFKKYAYRSRFSCNLGRVGITPLLFPVNLTFSGPWLFSLSLEHDTFLIWFFYLIFISNLHGGDISI